MQESSTTWAIDAVWLTDIEYSLYFYYGSNPVRIQLEWKVLDTWYAHSKSNSIGNANCILNNTTSWAHKKFVVTIAIILYGLSINKKFLKLQHPTGLLTKNNMFNMLLAY